MWTKGELMFVTEQGTVQHAKHINVSDRTGFYSDVCDTWSGRRVINL